jgi:hypothetical protein
MCRFVLAVVGDAVAVVAGLRDVEMVHEPVQQLRGHLRVDEHCGTRLTAFRPALPSAFSRSSALTSFPSSRTPPACRAP